MARPTGRGMRIAGAWCSRCSSRTRSGGRRSVICRPCVLPWTPSQIRSTACSSTAAAAVEQGPGSRACCPGRRPRSGQRLARLPRPRRWSRGQEAAQAEARAQRERCFIARVRSRAVSRSDRNFAELIHGGLFKTISNQDRQLAYPQVKLLSKITSRGVLDNPHASRAGHGCNRQQRSSRGLIGLSPPDVLDSGCVAPAVTALYRYPVKSCRGERLARATVEPWGLAGDRRWMLVYADGSPATAREHPRLVLVTARPERDLLHLTRPAAADLTVQVPRGDELVPVDCLGQRADRRAGQHRILRMVQRGDGRPGAAGLPP